ncbi:MAG: hypothetical protein M1819_006996 [Sarea resinae]|nr:MAG: hypothetical protein M1819_006996 [Sarea resinae]
MLRTDGTDDVANDVGFPGEPATRQQNIEHVADPEKPGMIQDNSSDDEKGKDVRSDGKIELQENDCYEKLGFSFPSWKKWWIITVIFWIQVSMNFNASIYSNAVPGIQKKFHVSGQAARVGQMIFLVSYAFGCELWAPWSEELGRRPIMQASLFFVNIWHILVALAPNFGSIIVGRFLGGISSAGGSVTLGMVADMWEPEDQQYAVAYVVLSSVGGSAVGPIVGGFMQEHAKWQWCLWVALIFGGVVQAVHFFTVPETRASCLIDKEAKRRRKAGETNVFGPDELKEHRMTVKEVLTIWSRPFYMFLREPIVLCLSLLSGFSDALIFIFLDSFSPVFAQWNFTPQETGMAFIAIMIGYFIAYFSFLPWIHKDRVIRRKDPDALLPEARLWWLLWLAPLEAIGLFGFAWTSLGPQYSHWIAPMIFAALIGIANYAIYMATIDYMVAAYGPYSASATGGNGFARDFLAGIAAMYSVPFYNNVGGTSYRYHLEWPTTILGVIAIMVAIPIYVFYWYGPAIRARSKFAQTLAADRQRREGRQPVIDPKVEYGTV